MSREHDNAIARHLESNRAAIMVEAREFSARNLCPLADAIKAVEDAYREGYFEEMDARRMGDFE